MGEKIRTNRELAGLSQSELAEIIGASGNSISRYELGEREMGIRIYFKIADALHVKLEALLPDRFCDKNEDRPMDPDIEILLSDFSELNQRNRKLLLDIGRLILELLKEDTV